jgi:amidase
MGNPDYVPPVNEERFSRDNVHFPKESENPNGAWAWKCTIVDTKAKGGKLEGKTFALKDNIAVKGVPMLLGTNFIKGYGKLA